MSPIRLLPWRPNGFGALWRGVAGDVVWHSATGDRTTVDRTHVALRWLRRLELNVDAALSLLGIAAVLFLFRWDTVLAT